MHPTEKNKIVIDEEVAPVVRRIFAMTLEGISCRQIAVRLNEEHIPTPATYAGLTLSAKGAYSGQWSAERINEMLKNETYHRPHGAGADGEDQLQVEKVSDAAAGKLDGCEKHPRTAGG